jgi:phosphonate transport system permease protein
MTAARIGRRLTATEARMLIEGRRQSLVGFGVVLSIAVLFVLALAQLGIDLERIARGTAQLGQFTARAFPPDVEALGRLWAPAIATLQIAFLGTALGLVMALVLGALAAKNLAPHYAISVGLKASFGMVRAVPALIWALLFIVAVGLGPLPGILALAVNSIGMLGKVFAEAFEEVDKGVIEMIRSTGGNWLQVVTHGIIPETVPTLVSWSIFRLDINVRYSSILGIVGAGGIGWELARASRMGDYAAAMTVTLVIFAMVFTIELITDRLRKLIR